MFSYYLFHGEEGGDGVGRERHSIGKYRPSSKAVSDNIRNKILQFIFLLSDNEKYQKPQVLPEGCGASAMHEKNSCNQVLESGQATVLF